MASEAELGGDGACAQGAEQKKQKKARVLGLCFTKEKGMRNGRKGMTRPSVTKRNKKKWGAPAGPITGRKKERKGKERGVGQREKGMGWWPMKRIKRR